MPKNCRLAGIWHILRSSVQHWSHPNVDRSAVNQSKVSDARASKASTLLTLAFVEEMEMEEKALKNLDKKLERYQELAGRRAALQQLLRKAQDQKASVKPDIYERVCNEYQSALEDVIKKIDPLHAEIEALRQSWVKELEDIAAQVRKVEETLQEVDFRYRVGEYDDDTHSEMKTPLEKRIEECNVTSDQIKAQLDQIGTTSPSTTDTEHVAPEPGETETTIGPDNDVVPGVDETIPSSQPKQTERTTPQPLEAQKGKAKDTTVDTRAAAEEKRQVFDSEGLIDLTDWTKEFQREQTGKRRATDSSSHVESASPANATKESTDALPATDASASEPQGSGATDTSQQGNVSDAKQSPLNGFPVLIITKGPGAGKKLPLVPITMTLGREHDNNIELKDEDVARYHARISFQNGNYVLEDLESSSGTWVNNEKITESTLTHGDKIRVGATEMIVDFD